MYYDISDEDYARVENEGTYHAPKDNQARRYELIREAASELKLTILGLTPKSREQSLALTAIDEATFWSNASIARHE